MRHAMLAALIAATVLVWPVHAQTATSRTLIDATVKVAPGEDTGICAQTESDGTMQIELRTTDGRDSDSLGAPIFWFAPYRTSPPGPNAPPEIWNQPVTATRTTMEIQVVKDLYCFNFNLATTPEIEAMNSQERRARFRYVAIKLTLVAR